MENKRSYFVRNVLCLMLIAILIGCIAVCSVGTVASGATDDNQTSNAEPRGLMTQMSLSIGQENGNVYARAHNDFTLGPSTIQVYVYLYTSKTFVESCSLMVLESHKYIGDLNINQTLETTAPINGVKRYWRAKMQYKLDNKDWVSKETMTYLVDVDGTVIY